MSEHLMNSQLTKSFNYGQLKVIKIALIYLRNDFDEDDLDSLGYTAEQLESRIDNILTNIEGAKI